jgi:hypothetical protein
MIKTKENLTESHSTNKYREIQKQKIETLPKNQKKEMYCGYCCSGGRDKTWKREDEDMVQRWEREADPWLKLETRILEFNFRKKVFFLCYAI